jgi:hypothetical protein
MPDIDLETLPELSDFPPDQRNPAVELLLKICHRQQREIIELREHVRQQADLIQRQGEQIQAQGETIARQAEEIQRLKDEIAVLKGEKKRPQIKPSTLNRDQGGATTEGEKQHQRGKPSRQKTHELKIHEEKILEPTHIPLGSRLKGYEDYTVQDIRIELHNTRYRRARYETPSGETIVAELPAGVKGFHFGPTLRSYILDQVYQRRVPQRLMLRELWEFGVQISAGELNRLITENHEGFHTEKEEVFRAGLEVSSHINVDDTGARHRGQNGYCTHIGNEFFACFSSTGSKSRINFLTLLQGERKGYVVNEVARRHMAEQRLPQEKLACFSEDHVFSDEIGWNVYLQARGLDERHRRIATEGALVASLVEHGSFPELVIMSDDAPQFRIAGFHNALCWIHAERTINKLVPFTDDNRKAVESVRDDIWKLYQDLKAYKIAPSPEQKLALGTRFDSIFSQKTCFQSLNLALRRLHENKAQLLLVLERPEIPLHNNLSENDIRDYVTKRKISATTRSDAGRDSRDTFLSLKKTCQKLGVSFWQYLLDRVGRLNAVPPLADLVRAASEGP